MKAGMFEHGRSQLRLMVMMRAKEMSVMTEEQEYNCTNNIKPDPDADAQREALADPRISLILTLTSAKDGVPPYIFDMKAGHLKYQLDKFLLTSSARKHGKFIRGISVAETQSNRIGNAISVATGSASHVKVAHNSLHNHSLIHSWDENLSPEELRDAMGVALVSVVPKVSGYRSSKPFFNLKGVDVRVVKDTPEDRRYLADYLTKELSTNQSDKSRFDMFSELSKGSFNINTEKLDKEYRVWH